MTAAQRRTINRRNAQKSTGPKTEEGKERSRRNALKHGLCAGTLALPTEDAQALREQSQDWIDHYRPDGPAELVLVEEAARAALRLKRCARHEAAVVAGRVRRAQLDWLAEQDDRLARLRERLKDDPEAAVRELKRFTHGRRWLLERWRVLGRWFLGQGYSPIPALTEEAVRLLGARPEKTRTGPLVGFRFRLCNAVARPDADQGAFLAGLLSPEMRHPEYVAEHGAKAPDQAAAVAEVKAIVRREIEALERLERESGMADRADFDEAHARAQVPADGPDARLALRYETMARSAFHKSLKELTRLQADRLAAEADEDEEDVAPAPAPSPAAARDEAKPPDEPPLKGDQCQSCADEPAPVPAASSVPAPDLSCGLDTAGEPGPVPVAPVVPVAPPLTALA